jgi:hypothetical protein
MTRSVMHYNPCQPVIDAVQSDRGQALRLADELALELVGWDHDFAGSVLSVLILGTALKEPAECTLAVMFERLVDRGQLLSFCEDLSLRGLQRAGTAVDALDRMVGVFAQNILEQHEAWPQTLLMARLRAAHGLRPFATGSALDELSAVSTVRFRSMEDWLAFRAELARSSVHGMGPFIWAARQDLAKHGVITTSDEMRLQWIAS